MPHRRELFPVARVAPDHPVLDDLADGQLVAPCFVHGLTNPGLSVMCLYSMKSSSTASPRMRPWPLCLKPPSSNWSCSSAQSLTQTLPASISRATRSGRSISRVEHGGFAAAERSIGIPRSRLSRHIALLESRLGVRLLERSTRKFAVTAIGLEYFRFCKAMLVDAESAQEVVDRSRTEPRGVVRLSCPTALVQFRVAPMLARFMVEW